MNLPSHLKQRGVHYVFHSSLLRIHIPNDDQLFPGLLDTQFLLGNNSEGDWAVDEIISHSGSKENSIFEILWQAGDITWLPYHQISHLNVLPVYLDLLGVSGISELPNGHGKLPTDDPQVFSGQLEVTPAPQHLKISSKPHHKYKHSTPLIPHLFHKTHAPFSSLSIFAIMPDTNIIVPDAPPIMAPHQDNPAPVLPAKKKVPRIHPCTITHMQIKCLSCTRFLATDHIKGEKFFFHAGQIANFCSTDTELQQCKVPIMFPSGYHNFMEVFHTYIEDNPIHFATYDAKAKAFDLNGNPVAVTKPRNNNSLHGWKANPRAKSMQLPNPLSPPPPPSPPMPLLPSSLNLNPRGSCPSTPKSLRAYCGMLPRCFTSGINTLKPPRLPAFKVRMMPSFWQLLVRGLYLAWVILYEIHVESME